MKRIYRPHGVITVPDHITVDGTQQKPTTTVNRGRLPSGPVPMKPTAATPATALSGEDPIVHAMLQQDLILVDEFSLDLAAAPKRRGAPEPAKGEWVIAADEDAVVLLESDGVYSWRYGKEVAATASTRRGVSAVAGTRTILFELGKDSSEAPTGAARGRRTRNLLSDVIIGKVRGWVFKFIARFAAEKLVTALERKQRVGLVWINGADPLQWKPIDALRDVPLPTDRTPRILLFVHGTFSSTLGSFGHLCPTSWGQSFLADAASQYDAIIGFDHRTLADDPLQNATQLLDRLEDSPAAALDVDAISFSRGGLVLRSLIEYLLPNARVRVRRAVFVAATNNGTELASPKNWNRLIDLSTNLVAASTRAIALFAPPAALATTITNHAIGSIGAFVKALATQILDERHVPGLAAMMPSGTFIAEINKTQPGQPAAAESIYYAITSDFDVSGASGNNAELPPGLVKWLTDVVVDAAMRGVPNDLVVDNASTVTIDPGTGAFIKGHRHFEKNPNIYHTVFFTRKEVTEAIGRWLEFTAPTATMPRTHLTIDAETRVVVVDTNQPFETAKVQIEQMAPEYVVARRIDGQHIYHYAFRPEELFVVMANDTERMSKPMELALKDTTIRLGEDSSSDELRDGQRRGSYGSRGLTTQRTVVLNGSAVTGVIDPIGRSTAALREVHVAARYRYASQPPLPTAESGDADNYTANDIDSYAYVNVYAHSDADGDGDPDTHTRGLSLRRGKPILRRDELTAIAPSEKEHETRPPPTAPIKIYAAADTSDEITVGKTVDLNVHISRDEIAVSFGSTRAAGSATVAPDRPLIVQVIPKLNLEVVGDSRADVDPTQSETRFIFELKGAAEGAGEVWVILRQGVHALLTLVLKPGVVSQSKKLSSTRTRDASSAAEAPADSKDYPVLQIFENQVGSQVRYQFILHMNARQYFVDYSLPLKVPQDQYVASIYSQIEGYWQSKPGDVPAFTSQLRAFGGTLFDALVPAAIQKPLWDARDKLKAIQVLAEEPFIPWELVHLKEPTQQGAPPNALPSECLFLGQKGLTRWLHNRGAMPTSVRVRDGRSYFVVPKYPAGYDLPEAQKEIPYLKRALGSVAVAPINANTIQSLLMQPNVDHFHFSGHGEADATNAALDAHLLISMDQAGSALVPHYLSSTVIGQMASLTGVDGNRPLVMLNACQVGRASWKLTSIGGFAEAFVSRGAGIFVGSLWSVGDEPARTFSEAFYHSLLEDKRPLAEAASAAREAARKAGDATWMAYVVYGYPYAMVTRG